jgi:hypothetical protein
MDEERVWDTFRTGIFSDLRGTDTFVAKKPLLAHYTSLEALEKILKSEEIWFSNPLYMNDFEEVQFGILEGVRVFSQSQDIAGVLGTTPRRSAFNESLYKFVSYFTREHLLDTYVFCLSNHEKGDHDGLLSMWRGYGGNGKGAALVFNAGKVTPTPGSPLILDEVKYLSGKRRIAWAESKAKRLAKLLQKYPIQTKQIYLAAGAAFARIKVGALFSKHDGFREEREWRVVYMREYDENNNLVPMQNYSIGPRGIEPKLRFKVGHYTGVSSVSLSLENIIHSILLGPSVSSALAEATVKRMLDVIGKPRLKKGGWCP